MNRDMLDAPFHCQWDVDRAASASEIGGVAWGRRTCAVACATMVLHHFGMCSELSRVMDVALDRDAFDAERGWRHAQIVEVLQSFGLIAYRRNWRLLEGREQEYLAGRSLTPETARELDLVRTQMLGEGMRTVQELLATQIPVIVSIYRPTGDHRSIGHQVLLLDVNARDVMYHDPAHPDGAHSRCERERFFANWKGTAIVARRPTIAESSEIIPRTG